MGKMLACFFALWMGLALFFWLNLAVGVAVRSQSFKLLIPRYYGDFHPNLEPHVAADPLYVNLTMSPPHRYARPKLDYQTTLYPWVTAKVAVTTGGPCNCQPDNLDPVSCTINYVSTSTYPYALQQSAGQDGCVNPY